jgi:hypothetical protein
MRVSDAIRWDILANGHALSVNLITTNENNVWQREYMRVLPKLLLERPQIHPAYEQL